ncbi:hypothetical protein [Spirosoma sp. KNUC1025]|uniref:hypothetical protein n=1 Tax=Spirosoma sp. KNUC1025 TaxID=2894082 RepID=UPI00386BDFD6|nr:hypothetical protein LN737_20720 [Spirosoma sp. KNUC1025]
MKRYLNLLLIGGFLVAISLGIYFYREYLGEDTAPEETSSTLIEKRLNAVVTKISPVGGGSQPKLEVVFSNIDTKESSSFMINDWYRQSIHVGDTLSKEKGEKIVLVYQKAGAVETVPID